MAQERDAEVPFDPTRDPSSGATATPMAAGAGELAWSAAALLALLASVVFVSGAWVAFERWFWLDEICTVLIAREPPGRVLELLRSGVDSNLPGLYGILGGLHALGVPLTEAPMRVVTFGAIWLAQWGLYANLRRVYPRLPAMVGVAALLTAGTLFRHTFELRFYGFWLAILMWEAYFLGRVGELGRVSWRHFVLIVLTAMAILIHYFGIFALTLMVAADFLADRRKVAEKLRVRWPVWVGCLVLPVLPYFFFSQRAALSAGTWIDPPTFWTSLTFLRDSVLVYPLLVLLVMYFICRGAKALRPPRPRQESGMENERALAGLGALILFPLFLVAFAWLVQPTLNIRYGIPGLAGGAVLAGALVSRLPRGLVMVALVLACGAVFLQYRKIPAEYVWFEPLLQRDFDAVAAMRSDAPVLFEARHEFYPAVFYRADLRKRAYFLLADPAKEDPATLPFASYLIAFEIQAHRSVERNFPAYQSMRRERADEFAEFFFVLAQHREHGADAAMLGRRFPGYKASAVSTGVYLLKRAS